MRFAAVVTLLLACAAAQSRDCNRACAGKK
jgi:hypothetical protein